jgi:hypothetical protein
VQVQVQAQVQVQTLMQQTLMQQTPTPLTTSTQVLAMTARLPTSVLPLMPFVAAA